MAKVSKQTLQSLVIEACDDARDVMELSPSVMYRSGGAPLLREDEKTKGPLAKKRRPP